MRFKNILLESEEEKIVEKIDQFLSTDYRRDFENLIYRGTSTPADVFDIRNIRKDRRSRNTRDVVDAIINAFEDVYYPHYPKRSGSKFGSVSHITASSYGTNVVVVFPEKEANVYSGKKDPSNFYFWDVFSSFKTIDNNYRFSDAKWDLRDANADFDNLIEFLGLRVE